MLTTNFALGLTVWLVLRPALGEGVQPERACTATGIICSTCDTVAACVGTGDGGFETLHQPCQEGEHCIAGTCVKGALCNYRPFSCSSEGWFPDPYDCKTYHICIRQGASFLKSTQQCLGSNVYDAKTEGCVSSLKTSACLQSPVPDCISRLQMGPVPGNSNLYYVCIAKNSTLAPELFRCPAGRHFSTTTVACA